MGDLAGEEVEKAVELVRVAAHRRRQVGRVAVRRGLDAPAPAPEAAAEPLDASEHAHRVALVEAAVEQLDVVPDARLDASARVDQLEREIGRAVARAPPLLSSRRRSTPSTVRSSASSAMLVTGQSRRGRRYARRAWPTSPRFAQFASRIRRPSVTAPPYDVLTPEQLRRLPGTRPSQRRAPDAERVRGGGGASLPGMARRGGARTGRRAGRMGGRAGVRRPGRGGPPPRRPRRVVRVEPYETGAVLPHERTHAGPKESRLRLLRAAAGPARADLPPLRRRAAVALGPYA